MQPRRSQPRTSEEEEDESEEGEKPGKTEEEKQTADQKDDEKESQEEEIDSDSSDNAEDDASSSCSMSDSSEESGVETVASKASQALVPVPVAPSGSAQQVLDVATVVSQRQPLRNSILIPLFIQISSFLGGLLRKGEKCYFLGVGVSLS